MAGSRRPYLPRSGNHTLFILRSWGSTSRRDEHVIAAVITTGD